uniref:Uncharacterized protein n=1 Tax=Chromera velia CCMP2878 TaxID=1169474 RepID=A0A0G4H9T5_9ALVE|eukprot:Cvel_5970.t1-p1 / transcript=Cvel_5970.t1 / gene=Cvel_5970 / organism=Chromera_velia_CCMP2878 / gene_product=hypothetical protein / transcript_product=hypothetical protein / location=Cvel_scaffold286:10347-10802(-) / protein_length=152 / sequence_SO=supercontig / SO=protein_coding / is_pseudo=false
MTHPQPGECNLPCGGQRDLERSEGTPLFVSVFSGEVEVYRDFLLPCLEGRRSLIFRSICKTFAESETETETSSVLTFESPSLFEWADLLRMRRERERPQSLPTFCATLLSSSSARRAKHGIPPSSVASSPSFLQTGDSQKSPHPNRTQPRQQ